MSLYKFRALNTHLQEDTLYTCSIWYCHSLREFVVACRCTVWVRTDCHCWFPSEYYVKITCRGNLRTCTLLQFYILLTVHHVMILGKWPTWCTNSFPCINRNKYIEKNLCITLVIYQESLLQLFDKITLIFFFQLEVTRLWSLYKMLFNFCINESSVCDVRTKLRSRF